MINVGTFFFPDEGYAFLASLCYLLIFLSAYKRFNALIMNHGTYDAPETARPWTTWLRYHSAAAIYACLCAIIFALLYQLFHKHPALISACMGLLANSAPSEEFLKNIQEDMKLISPILALILLTLAAEKYRRTTEIDRKLRYYFQLLGSIPGAVSHTIRKLKKYELEINIDECGENLTDEMKQEVMLPMLQKDRKSLEHLYLRACHLFKQIDRWGNMDSEFYQFKSAYHQSFENIKTRFNKLNRNAKRYYHLKLKLSADAPFYAHNAEDNASYRFDHMYPKVLTELRKDLKNDLKGILDNIYTFIACAVHSKGVISKKRLRLLASFGFQIDRSSRFKLDGIDPNDLTILALFLIFVIPLAAIFASAAGDPNPVPTASLTYVAWTAMALFVGLTSVSTPVVVKQIRGKSDNCFWQFIRPKKGRPWCSYVISGIFAGAIGVIGMCLLNYLDPHRQAKTFLDALKLITPWGLVPLSIAVVLGYHLDRKDANGKRTILKEASTTMLFSVLAAVMALSINEGVVEADKLVKKMYFSIPASALLGCMIGVIIPYRYRRQLKRQVAFRPDEVDLKKIIHTSKERYAARAEKEHVTIRTDFTSPIPKLRADPAQLVHAINGLLSNALEFTPPEGEILISAGLNDEGGIWFAVKDNGIGMSQYKMNAVNKATPQEVETAWSQVADCVDADLLQVRAIAENHDGKFRLKSEQWAYTEVAVDFPKEAIIDEKQDAEPGPVVSLPVAMAAAQRLGITH